MGVGVLWVVVLVVLRRRVSKGTEESVGCEED